MTPEFLPRAALHRARRSATRLLGIRRRLLRTQILRRDLRPHAELTDGFCGNHGGVADLHRHDNAPNQAVANLEKSALTPID